MKILLSTLLLISLPAMSQGYDKTKWGMTQDEIKALYPERTFSTKHQNGTPTKPGELITDSVIVLEIEVDMRFHFSSSGLDEVGIFIIDNYLASKGMKISRALLEKYGTPSSKTSTQNTWIKDDTVVTDHLMQLGQKTMYTVTYKKRITSGI